jgi:hypothetical protein
MEILKRAEADEFSETLDSVHNPGNSECCVPLSEPFTIYTMENICLTYLLPGLCYEFVRLVTRSLY